MNDRLPSPSASPTQVSSREWISLVLICLVGTGLRFWRFDRLSIEHFDEGVYAGNLYSVLDDNCYPSRHLYAPPLLPLLSELAIGLGGTPDAAIWINLLFGTLMVPLVWLVVRDLVGPIAAITAGVLCATSEYHIFFSRSALTDVSLSFWLLLSVWLTIRGMQSGDGIAMGGAAVSAALGWWTKYNGWLAIAIPLGGWCVAYTVARYRKSVGGATETTDEVRWIGIRRWLFVAILAALLWSPVVYDLRSVGGYAAVSANHSRYVVGWSGWWEGFRMHIAFQGWLTTWMGCGLAGVLLSLLLPWRPWRAWAVGLVGLASVVATMSVGLTLGLASLVVLGRIVRHWWSRAENVSGTALLIEAVFVVWWLGLTLTTPLYQPYARLSLPWLVSCWVLVACGVSDIFQRAEQRLPSLGGAVSFIIAGLVAGILLGRPRESSLDHIWGDRTSLRKSTLQILHETEMAIRDMPPSESSDCDYAIYVVGEPALFCHLTQLSDAMVVTKPASRVIESAAPHRIGPDFPKFLVTGPHVPESEVNEGIAAGLIEPIWEQQVLVSDLVTLDSASREQLQRTTHKSMGPPMNHVPIRVFRIVE